MVYEDLIDELALRKFVERFARRLDDQDAHGIASMFVEDGVLVVSGKRLVGKAEIAAFFVDERQFVSEPVDWTVEGQATHQPRGIHLTSSPVVNVEGDVATVESDCVTVHRDENGHPRLGILCRYRDRLRRVDGTWLLTERIAVGLRRREASETAHLPKTVRTTDL